MTASFVSQNEKFYKLNVSKKNNGVIYMYFERFGISHISSAYISITNQYLTFAQRSWTFINIRVWINFLTYLLIFCKRFYKRINSTPRLLYASKGALTFALGNAQFYRDSRIASWINWRKDSGVQRMVMEQTRIKEMRTKARGGNYSDKRGGEQVTAEPCSIIPSGIT